LLEPPRVEQPEVMFSMAPPAVPPLPAWVRIEVEPGLELHVREDYRPPAEAKERRLLLEIKGRSRAPEE
jgi:hypothetical protein